jgi:hypothetical protein
MIAFQRDIADKRFRLRKGILFSVFVCRHGLTGQRKFIVSGPSDHIPIRRYLMCFPRYSGLVMLAGSRSSTKLKKGFKCEKPFYGIAAQHADPASYPRSKMDPF